MNTPALTTQNVITINSPETEVIVDDLRQLNRIFCNLEGAWSSAESIDDVCKLSITTVKVMEHRRRVLGLDTSANNKPRYLTPYDD